MDFWNSGLTKLVVLPSMHGAGAQLASAAKSRGLSGIMVGGFTGELGNQDRSPHVIRGTDLNHVCDGPTRQIIERETGIARAPAADRMSDVERAHSLPP